MYQKATGTVRIAGSLLSTVQKTGITPAELIVLRQVHGNDAVVQLQAERMEIKGESASEELERLEKTYGPEVVAKAFPGHSPKLPKTFKEIGININAETKRTEAVRELEQQQLEEVDAEDEVDKSQDIDAADRPLVDKSQDLDAMLG